MNLHLHRLSALESFDGQFTVVVVGAGLTGIELACELPARLLQLAGASRAQSVRVVLVDANSQVAQSMGNEAQAVIAQALSDLKIEVRCGRWCGWYPRMALSLKVVSSYRPLRWCGAPACGRLHWVGVSHLRSMLPAG